MLRMLGNAEYKAIMFRILLLMGAFTAALALMVVFQTGRIQSRLIDQSAAVIGKALSVSPRFEHEIVGAVVVPASAEDISRGRAALAASGYDGSAPISVDPILGNILPQTVLGMLAAVLLCSFAAMGLLTGSYARLYQKVRAISEAAEKVVDGDTSIQLPAGGEGEFEILGHRFNQMANRLRLNVEHLMAEKVFLKNTISDISHQLKTPLSTLIVYNDLMAENENMDAAQRRSFLELGRQQLQRLEWLIQSLLKMARLEAGSIAFRKEAVLLRDVAVDSAAAMQTAADDTGVSVVIRERQKGACYAGDASWLTEAVINILKNSIEHSRPGGVIEIALDHTPMTASLTVTDRGEGIAPVDLPHIFERFYKSSVNVKPNSIGIGLAMAKAIVEGQGGSVTVKSELGKGSEFSIIFLKTLGEV